MCEGGVRCFAGEVEERSQLIDGELLQRIKRGDAEGHGRARFSLIEEVVVECPGLGCSGTGTIAARSRWRQRVMQTHRKTSVGR